MRAAWETLRGERGRTRKLGKLLALLRPYRGRVMLMFVALVLATAASLAPPYLAGRAIDDGIRAGDTGVLTVVLLVFVGAGLNWAATYVQTYLVSWVGQRALQDLRTRIFSHFQSLSIGFYSRNKAGVLISRLTNDVQALDQLVTDGIVTLFSAVADAGRHRGDPAVPRPRAGAGDLRRVPGAAGRQCGFRIASAGAYRLTREQIARSPRTCRRRCRASGSCARSARSRATSGASPSSTTRTARPTCAR